MSNPKKGTFLQALIPLAVLVTLLVLNVSYFEDDASYGPNQIALLLAAAIAGVIAVINGLKWDDLLNGILKSINQAMPSILILMLIGALAGTWLISGIVPAMIYYGLEILSPKIFLFAACLVCMIVSLATGSSWSTAATVGVALIGIGQALGFNVGLVAGAVISGSYFGDKMSPLSDTTNLAPAMAGSDLFTHIRYMTYTTVPSIAIALIIFLIIGFSASGPGNEGDILAVQTSIQGSFNISPWLFLVPLIVIILIIKKVPALPALLVGVLLGGFVAVTMQSELILDSNALSDGESHEPSALIDPAYTNGKASIMVVTQAMFGDVQVVSDNAMVADLLSSSGMMGMMFVILLVITAMVFGGMMETGGFLQAIVNIFIHRIKRTTPLVASTAGTCVFFNLTASEQYVSIVVPGRMFSSVYDEKNLPPELLSRTLEDSGTVTSVLVPWNSCGAYHKGVLGVDPIAYLPYCFFNLISPLMSIAVTATGYKIAKKVSKAD